MAFAGVLCFYLSPALPDMGAKMPLAGRRAVYKRREATGGHRDMGKKKPRPREAPGGL